jgi:hypothetical protein
MIRWFFYLIASVMLELLNIVIAPVVTMFPVSRVGWCNNHEAQAISPRLPLWLAWFDTPDNSLMGDDGYFFDHAPFPTAVTGWRGWVNRWFWLRRNSCYGFKWSVLAAEICPETTFEVKGDLSINHRTGKTGTLLIRASNGYWQIKSVARWPWSKTAGYMVSMGWLLDSYVSNPKLYLVEPKAIFQFEPRLVKIGL